MKNYYRVFLYPEYKTEPIKEIAIMLCEYNTAKITPDLYTVADMLVNLVKSLETVPFDVCVRENRMMLDVEYEPGKWHTALCAEYITVYDFAHQETEY